MEAALPLKLSNGKSIGLESIIELGCKCSSGGTNGLNDRPHAFSALISTCTALTDC